MKNRKLLLLVLFLGVLLILPGCLDYQDPTEPETKPVNTIADLAYGNNTVPNRIYIVENEQYVPYLVLTDDYNGNCLLLREYLLDEPMQYNDPNIYYSGYYENSTIDQYLNNDFYSTLSDYTALQTLDSSIIISAMENYKKYFQEQAFLLTIQRKVFLLSYAELNGGGRYYHWVKEGDPLRYFDCDVRAIEKRRIAFYNDGEAGGWWLRTPKISEHNGVGAVTFDGMITSPGVIDLGGIVELGVRPAFCLPGDLKVAEIEVDDESIFILSEDKRLG